MFFVKTLIRCKVFLNKIMQFSKKPSFFILFLTSFLLFLQQNQHND